jgi:hypothetical protein
MAGAPRGTNLVDREAIGFLGCERALGARVIERPITEVDGERVLDHLDIALAGRADVLLASSPNQLLIKRQADSLRSHGTRMPLLCALRNRVALGLRASRYRPSARAIALGRSGLDVMGRVHFG